MKSIYFIFLTILLAACGAVPDEISASGFTSRYEFLGAGSLKGDGNDYGDEQGVMLTATYKLKPQSIRIVEPVRINPISPVVAKREEEPDLEKDIFSKGYLEEKAKKITGGIIDDALGNIVQAGKEKIDIENIFKDYLSYILGYKNQIIILIFFAFLLLITRRIYNSKK